MDPRKESERKLRWGSPDADGSGSVWRAHIEPDGPVRHRWQAVSLQFTGYIVDGSHIQLIETDAAAGAASPFGLTAGPAIGQGTATGTFTGNASFTGTKVFGIPGVDLSNSNLAPSTLTSAGLFTADGAAI